MLSEKAIGKVSNMETSRSSDTTIVTAKQLTAHNRCKLTDGRHLASSRLGIQGHVQKQNVPGVLRPKIYNT